MTHVDTETGEIVEPMSIAEAEHITDSISWRLDTIATAHEEVMPMIREALSRRAWDALGYASPGAYTADKFGGALHRLSVPVRQAVVLELTEAGMSTRAIGPVVGVSHEQVRKDQQRPPVNQLTPASPAPDAVTGIDGKSYARPGPRPTVADAVIEFPDLAYYADLGEDRDVLNMAGDLRRFRDRGELDERLDNLRRSIAVDRAKRNGTYATGATAVLSSDGEYRMAQVKQAATPTTTRTCPTCNGRGTIKEQRND